MRVYLPAGRRNHTLLVTPGADDPTNSEWLLPDGTPRQLRVKFIAGMAEVPGGLGRWLLDKGLARKTPSSIIVSSPHIAVPETRVRTQRALG